MFSVSEIRSPTILQRYRAACSPRATFYISLFYSTGVATGLNKYVRPSPTTWTQLSGENVSLLKPDQVTSEIKKKRIKIPTQCISNTTKKCSIFSMPNYLDASQTWGSHAKTGHGPHSSQLVICVVLCTVCV